MKKKVSKLPGKRIIATAVFVTFLISSVVSAQTLDDIKWFTEEYPPYNYSENGTPKGLCVEILLELWKRAGLNKTARDILVVSWPRGVEKIKSIQGTCLFTTTLTAERSDVFGWKYVYPVPYINKASNFHLIAKKNMKIKFDSLDEIKKYKRNFGVVRDDIGELLLLNAGVSDDRLNKTPTPEFLANTIYKGRHDVIAYDFSAIAIKMKALGIDPKLYEIVYTFPDMPLGYAFHHNTSQQIIGKLQKILDELYLDGTIETILKRYTQKQ